jgi:hypothetical protein
VYRAHNRTGAGLFKLYRFILKGRIQIRIQQNFHGRDRIRIQNIKITKTNCGTVLVVGIGIGYSTHLRLSRLRLLFLWPEVEAEDIAFTTKSEISFVITDMPKKNH